MADYNPVLVLVLVEVVDEQIFNPGPSQGSRLIGSSPGLCPGSRLSVYSPCPGSSPSPSLDSRLVNSSPGAGSSPRSDTGSSLGSGAHSRQIGS